MNRARPEKEDAHIGGWKALPCNSGLSDGDIQARLAAGWEPETPDEYIAVVRYQAKGIPDVMSTESIDPRIFDSKVSSSASETPQTILHKLAVESLLPHPLWAQQTLASFASARQTLQRREKLIETRKDVRPAPGCPMPKSANVKDWLVACFGWADVGPGPVELLELDVVAGAEGGSRTDGSNGAAAGVDAGGAASGAKRRLPLSTHEVGASHKGAVADGSDGLSALQPPAAKRWRGGQADDGDDGDDEHAGIITGHRDTDGLRQQSGSATPPPAGTRNRYSALTGWHGAAAGLGPYIPTSPGAAVVVACSGGGSGKSAGEVDMAPAAGGPHASQRAEAAGEEAEGEEAAWDEEEVAAAWEEGAEGGGDDEEEEEDDLGLEGLGDVEFHVPVELLPGAGGSDPATYGTHASEYPSHHGAAGATCAAGAAGGGTATVGLPSRCHSTGSSTCSDAGLTVPLQSALLSLDQLEANRTLRRFVGWFARRLELLVEAEAGAAGAMQRTLAAGNAALSTVSPSGTAAPQQPQPAAGSVAPAGLGATLERQRGGTGARLSAVALLRGTMITSTLFDTEGAPAPHRSAGCAAAVVVSAGEVSSGSSSADGVGDAGGWPASDSSAAPVMFRPDFLAAAAPAAPEAATTPTQVAAAARGGYLITPAAAAWLYGLLLRLETPLLSDSSAVLRQLFVLCRRAREWLARHPPPPPPPSAAVLAAAGSYCASARDAGSAAGTAGDAASGGGAKQAEVAVAQRGLHAGLVAAINTIAVVTGTFYAQRLQGED